MCKYRTPLQIREHLFPELFKFKLADTVIPPKRIVKKYENIRERGAIVDYNIPLWKQ